MSGDRWVTVGYFFNGGAMLIDAYARLAHKDVGGWAIPLGACGLIVLAVGTLRFYFSHRIKEREYDAAIGNLEDQNGK